MVAPTHAIRQGCNFLTACGAVKTAPYKSPGSAAAGIIR